MILKHVTEDTPLPAIFVGMCCGILLLSHEFILLGFAVLLSIFLVDTRRILHFTAGLFIGIVSISFAPKCVEIPDGQYLVKGTVYSAGFNRGTFRVTLKDFSVDNDSYEGLARLSIYEHVGKLDKGDFITAHAHLKNPRMLGNDGEFDYKAYLLSQGIVLTGSIKNFMDIDIIHQRPPFSLRSEFVSWLSALGRPEAEILKAILAGDRSGLTYDLRDSFAALGIAHILAISGLHIGIIILMGYGAVFSVLRIIPPLSLRIDTPLISKAGGIVCASLYTIFAGATIPTLRAAIMAGCVLGSLFFSRKANLMESLSLAGIVILVIWPLELFSVSFLLSFTAVLGIIAVYSRLETCPKWVILIGIPFGAMIFTLPVVIYVFGFISPWGFFSNLIVVPFFSFIVMPSAIAGFVLFPFSAGVSTYLLSLSMDGIELILKICNLIGMLMPVARPCIIWVLTCYIGLITAFFSRHSRLRTFVVSISCILVISSPFISKAFLNSQPLCFDFISVGQGDSALITKGEFAVLIDAGGSYSGFDTGRFVVGPHLLHRGITTLDLVVITHTHPDHIGGMPFILERFEVKEVWTNVHSDRSRYFQDVMRITKEKSISVKTVGSGDTCSLYGIEIEVLNPPKTDDVATDLMDQNLHSIVLKISDENMGGLFMADADGFGEIRVSRLDCDLSADVLKAAHHGSRSSCLAMFLDRVNPRIAVISCGYENRYNLPNKDTLARLNDHNVQIFRTDIHGETVVYGENMGINVKSLKIPADKDQDRHEKCIYFMKGK